MTFSRAWAAWRSLFWWAVNLFIVGVSLGRHAETHMVMINAVPAAFAFVVWHITEEPAR